MKNKFECIAEDHSIVVDYEEIVKNIKHINVLDSLKIHTSDVIGQREEMGIKLFVAQYIKTICQQSVSYKKLNLDKIKGEEEETIRKEFFTTNKKQASETYVEKKVKICYNYIKAYEQLIQSQTNLGLSEGYFWSIKYNCDILKTLETK